MQICYAIENKLFMHSGLWYYCDILWAESVIIRVHSLFDAKLVGVVCVSVVACIAQQN